MRREEKVKKLIALSSKLRLKVEETGETINSLLIEMYTTGEHE